MKRNEQMNKTVAKRPTLIVREVMRKHGKTMIWTNKYRTMRSVKCYSSNKAKDIKLASAIENALRKAGVKMIGFNYPIYNFPGYGPIGGFIVRLPLEQPKFNYSRGY